MPSERFRHIFLPGPTRTQGYTNPNFGGGRFKNPPRDRANHSLYLQRRLAEAWDSADTARAVAHSVSTGTYIQFVSEPEFDLSLKSLEYIRSGIRLVNVKKQGEPEQTLATVYVPNNKRHLFINKIRKYAEEDTKTNKPKSASLIESISDIQLAVWKSFWQDDPALIPSDDPIPIEVWLSTDNDEKINSFNDLLDTFNITRDKGILKFPERSIEVIHVNSNNLEKLVQNSDDIAEFRAVSPIASFFIELSNQEQLALVQDILKRTSFEQDSNVVICLLDTGVNNGHLLLNPVLSDTDLLTARTDWGIDDHNGHGTRMAGIAAYGDILKILNNKTNVRVSHRLESVKILPPPPAQNPKELWGYITSQGLYRAEIQSPQRIRITCIAVTSTEDRERGRPSSWSAALDSLTSGYGDEKNTKRLIIISAGNISDSLEWLNYPDSNKTNEVYDPAQSWNTLTVGSFTEKIAIKDTTLAGFTPIAPKGGLSPFSTTSSTWQRKWPIKPEIVVEGGNAARGPNHSVLDSDDLALLSTYRDPQVAQFAPFNMTSASAAQAALLAAQIQTRYPDAWPETIRALLVHSAQWTDTMKSQFMSAIRNKTDYARLLRICGYGTPILDDALYCAANSLTLVSQAELQPYDRKEQDNTYITRDMHLYDLPWPKDILAGLGETPVTMRITLSYFIEPGPGEIGWDNRYRYPSHGLRFDINSPTESEVEFIRRINKQARDDGEKPGTQSPNEKWLIGDARNVGSIHSDIWQGRAVDLASSNKIAVYPTVGWWRERNYLKSWDKKCRYSLIVSIHTPSNDIDIYTPVAIQVGVVIPINITTTS